VVEEARLRADLQAAGAFDLRKRGDSWIAAPVGTVPLRGEWEHVEVHTWCPVKGWTSETV
jgi:hypothetical protein